MLERLTIKNIAVIESAEIEFKGGLNVLSGETGAGKSIVLAAISLLLGERSSVDLIRTGTEEALVEGVFDLSRLPWVAARLQECGLPASSSDDRAELLIKRTVHRGGRHRIAINGETATLSALQRVSEGLIDLCSQHEHQSLVKPAVQLDLLDRYGGLLESVAKFSDRFAQWKSVGRELEQLEAALAEAAKQRDFLAFQIQEIEAAELVEGEEQKLAQEKQLLQSARGRAEAAQAAVSAMESEDGGALQSLKLAVQRLRPVIAVDPSLAQVAQRLEASIIEVEDVSLALNKALESIELDPVLLEKVQERLSLLADLRRKYGASSGEILRTLEDLRSRLHAGEVSETRSQELRAERSQIQSDLEAQSKVLSKKRHAVSKTLAESVTAELRELNMSEAQFEARVEPSAAMGPSGSDTVQFEVRTNAGGALLPLGRIASGGELSRLLLSIRRVISDRGGIGVYLFDEIDAGMGGQTAFQVGKKLLSVSRDNQVICITHLPQVAAFADHHLVVRKQPLKGKTVTQVGTLSADDRRDELARMLGGPELTAKSVANASELMGLARKNSAQPKGTRSKPASPDLQRK